MAPVRPNRALSDYESAMRNAIAGEYPNIDMRCCWFHFCQSVKKNASKIAGFVHMIRSNLLEREIYYKLMCVPLLPPEMICTAFEILKKKSARITHAQFHEFLEYYERQWINRVRLLYFLQVSFAIVLNLFELSSFTGGARENFRQQFAHTHN